MADKKKTLLGLSVVGKDYPVPLKEIDVKVTIRGFTANVVSTLNYKNTETNPIEAVFEFPLDDQSAVYQFEAHIEDRIIVAECQEKQQAKETYDDAIEAGYTATLLEEDGTASDIFRCVIGNLPPSVDATIKFAYVIELALTPEGTVAFVLPTQLNPRYSPNDPASAGATSSPEFVYVAADVDQPYTFTFQANIFSSTKITSVTSRSTKDELAVTFGADGTQAEVKLTKAFIADHELSLDVKYEQEFMPHVIIEKGDTQKTGILRQDVVMLNFFPQLSESEFSSRHEFIFIIDCSGSMGGERIDSARNALLVFMRSLPPGCYFNIIRFGSHFELLFPEGSREYGEESLKAACELQKQLGADMGGTEILEPLKAVYDKPAMASHSRQIMLLTDGEVSNTQEVVDLVRSNASLARVFSFGIGEGASTSLVKGIARAGRGRAEFVPNDSQTTALVMKTLKLAMQATVTDLCLEWHLGGSVKLAQVPRMMPPLFAGDRLIVYAVNSSEQSVLDGHVELKGRVSERPIQFRLDVASGRHTSPTDNALPIHRLAAKAEINHLQDREKELTDKIKSEIVLLSLAANIVSRHTSMVGVDKGRAEKVSGDSVQRSVPLIMSPQSAYSGFLRPPRMCMGMPQAAYMPMPRMLCAMTLCSMESVLGCDYSSPTDLLVDDSHAAKMSFPISPPAAQEPAPAAVEARDYVAVIELQTFAGCWKLDEKLADLTGIGAQQLNASNPLKCDEAWATIVALALLAGKFSDKKDEWEMIELKARRWLSGQDLEGHTVDDLLARAAGVISP